MDNERWEQRYVSGDLPWDRRTPTEHLAWAIRTFEIAPGKAIDIGCGTGTNAIWLAGQGFEASGVDISPTAVEQARAKAEKAGIRCTFASVDFLRQPVDGGPFAFALDRGCFHSFDDPADRATFAKAVAELLEAGGLWLSLIGSTDTTPRDVGPPQRSARDVVEAVEGPFEILRLEAARLGSEENTFAAWRCVMRKRDRAK